MGANPPEAIRTHVQRSAAVVEGRSRHRSGHHRWFLRGEGVPRVKLACTMNRALPVLGSEKEANTHQIARYTNPNYLIYFEVENKQKSLLKTKENCGHLEGDKTEKKTKRSICWAG